MLRKILLMLISILLLSFLTFVIIYSVPGSFYNRGILSGVSRERIKALENAGSDSVIKNYGAWLSGAIKGELGNSLEYKKPVMAVIKDKWKETFWLSAFALLLELILGILVSSCIVRFGKKRLISSINNFSIALLMSVPVFVIAIILRKIFSYDLRLLPFGGFKTVDSGFAGMWVYVDVLLHLILPGITLALASLGGFVKLMTASIADEMEKQYITYARARGFGQWQIIFRFALKNARIPLWWHIINSIPYIFGGAIVVEKIFAIDGLGNMAYSAAMARDFPLLMGYTFIFGTLIVLSNGLSDIIYKKADARIREG
jgi:peptide/nickel transport system permease protein